MVGRQGPKRVADLPCTAWNSGDLGDLAIARDTSNRNRRNGLANTAKAQLPIHGLRATRLQARLDLAARVFQDRVAIEIVQDLLHDALGARFAPGLAAR